MELGSILLDKGQHQLPRVERWSWIKRSQYLQPASSLDDAGVKNMNISKEDDRSGALLSESQGCGGEAAAGGWVRGIGCGTCNDNSTEKDGRACEAAGGPGSVLLHTEEFPPMICLATWRNRSSSWI